MRNSLATLLSEIKKFMLRLSQKISAVISKKLFKIYFIVHDFFCISLEIFAKLRVDRTSELLKRPIDSQKNRKNKSEYSPHNNFTQAMPDTFLKAGEFVFVYREFSDKHIKVSSLVTHIHS